MNKVKKWGVFLLNLVELYIPICAFCILFLTFVWSIFSRYVLKAPCSWATDVELGCYIWTILFAASYGMRKNKHVRMTVVYDALKPVPKLIMRIVSNLLVVVPFALLLGPTISYISRLRLLSPALKLPVKFYYGPIIWFVASVLIYSAIALIKDLKIALNAVRGIPIPEEEEPDHPDEPDSDEGVYIYTKEEVGK